MQKNITTVQLGKQGITTNFILALKNQFNIRRNIKIAVLSSARGEGKEAKIKVKEYADKILEQLGTHYTAKIIGFTISIKKWRKSMVSKE